MFSHVEVIGESIETAELPSVGFDLSGPLPIHSVTVDYYTCGINSVHSTLTYAEPFMFLSSANASAIKNNLATP